MNAASRLADPGIFERGTEANCGALEELAELLRGIGFKVEKKHANESTLRVYPEKFHQYPLLNPFFDGGQLRIQILSKEGDASLDSTLAPLGRIRGATFTPSNYRQDGYRYHGFMWFTLNRKAGLAALLAPLTELYDLLVHRGGASAGGAPGPAGVADRRDEAGTRSPRVAAPTAADDIAQIWQGGAAATEKAAMTRCRLGQGTFRDRVLARWEGQCAVTGVDLPDLIRASHIKPWRACSDDERLDGNNGLPLVAHLDALFDRGWISFGDRGGVLISPRVPEDLVARLRLGACRLRVAPGAATCGYLAFHRAEVFKAS